MNVTVTNPVNNTTDPATGVAPFGRLRLDFSGAVSDGHCAGDGFTFLLPNHLTIPSGTTFPLKAADGSVVANLRVAGRTVEVTLTSYVENHDDVKLNGWFQAQIDNAAGPGETVNLEWNINGRTLSTPVTMGSCTRCSGRPNGLSKWGTYDEATGIITVHLSLPAATTDDQVFTFTDELTSTGQAFTCPVSATSVMYNTLNAWGGPARYETGPTPAVSSCSDTALSGTITVPKGYTAVISFPEKVTDASQPSWSDTATVTTNGQTYTRSAQSSAFGGGGGASGRLHPSPTTSDHPTATASASGSTTPVPTGNASSTSAGSPSSTGTSTASGSASASGGGTSTGAPSSGDDGVPTATARGGATPITSTPTGSLDPSASGTTTAVAWNGPSGAPPRVLGPDNVQARAGASTLPRTGTEVAEVVGAAATLIGGGAAMLAGSRRRQQGAHR